MPFQRQGILFGIRRNGRIFLGDEMGLGKTIQAIGIAQYYRSDWPLLVVCPSSLKSNWVRELIKWLPDLSAKNINLVDGANSDDILFDDHLVHIVSYDLMARDAFIEKIKSRKKKFKVIICDESHIIKNSEAKRTKAVRPLVKQSKRAIMISGTATPSRPLELLDQLKCVFKDYMKVTKNQYGLRYCDYKMTHFGADYKGNSHLEELNAMLIRMGFLRRRKQNVMTQLPPKIRKHLYLPTNKTTQLNVVLDEEGGEIKADPKNIKMFSQAGTAKLPSVLQFLRDKFLHEDFDKKLIVFAHHKKVMDGIQQELEKRNIHHIRIDGETHTSIRQDLCKEFCQVDTCKIALLSITVAGTGLNFVPCSTVVFAELFWNPGTLLQAEDRVHRIGQEAESVDVYYLLGEGTLDQVLWPLIQRKLSVVGRTLDGLEAKMDTTYQEHTP
ncbi:hypothetical protein AKO1_001482 [Acrasis kona]|uniref:SWI/SNF-related matrix-associated actin-dependent regulator of chromatin subfamily A-like protein 1 n=1 Tax=Acrasis kona TaxID=1008807 RepID=A0AAW2ZAM9_9EUKA